MTGLGEMPRLAIVLLLGLAACGSDDNASEEAPVPIQGWHTASGKSPTKAELTAVVASCQDRAKRGSSFDSCLTDLGLRRSP